jgi:hypothetical protein
MNRFKFFLVLAGIFFNSLQAQDYFRDGDGDGSPNYPVVVNASDQDDDLIDVELRFRPNDGVTPEGVVGEEFSASATGEGNLVINYDHVITHAPGTLLRFRALGTDLGGNNSGWVYGEFTVSDRVPIASVASTNKSGLDFTIGFASSSEEDNDLDYAELFYRFRLESEPTFSAWTQLDFSTLSTVSPDGVVNGNRLEASSSDSATLGATVQYTAAQAGVHQFNWRVYDAPEGDGALSASVIAEFAPSLEVKINAIAYPKPGYEAWFETSDLKSEVYDVQ